MHPRLDHAKRIALDFETHDPDLKELGPGPRRPDTRILGAAVSDGERSWYFENRPGLFEWLNQYHNKDWVFANALYDTDFAHYHGLTITGNIYDVQVAEPLLDEYEQSYSLDSLAFKYLGETKKKSSLDEWVTAHGLKGDARKYLAEMPVEMVAEYAKQDALLTYRIFEKQEPLLLEHGLWDVFMLETDLLKVLLLMKTTGVRIDEAKIEQTIAAVTEQCFRTQDALDELAGQSVNVNSSKQLAEVFRQLGYSFGFTDKGSPSFTAEFLEAQNHELAQMIVQVRQLLKLDGTFLTGLKRFIVNGRIHTSFHPLRSDRYGTISGRLSASQPNLQQIPARQPAAKKAVRGLFIPEDGCLWAKMDYSQIEQRLLVHYARGVGAKEMQAMYREFPETDFHTETAKRAGIDRRIAKTINFGINYGMGARKLARTLGVEESEAYEFLNDYHRRLPFLKETFNQVQNVFVQRGYIKTISGRQARYTGDKPHVALNRLIQGSAADVMKKALVDAYKAGLFDVLVPHLTVHDEIDVSVPEHGEEALNELKRIFESAYEFRVPLLVDIEKGLTWAGE